MSDYRAHSDLRILRLALNMEETFERYEEHLRDEIPEPAIRARLAALFEEGPHHRQLRRVHDELSRDVDLRSGSGLTTRDILQTLLDCERGAHEFYLHQLDLLSDPQFVALFRELAAEEAEHMAAVEAALNIHAGLERARPAPGTPTADGQSARGTGPLGRAGR